MSTTVWSKPRCVQCNAVYRWLDDNDVAYESKSLPEHPEDLERLKEQGFMQAPIVESGDVVFSGFNPGELQKLL